MRHTSFSIHFRGHSSRLSPGVLIATATAPSCALVTQIAADGIRAWLEPGAGEEAHLECRLSFVDEEQFEEVGTISFGNGNALRFRTAGRGRFGPCAVPGLHHGVAAWEIDGGAGAFRGATGRIVSNFLLADTGELTDHQLGVLFLPEPQAGGRATAAPVAP